MSLFGQPAAQGAGGGLFAKSSSFGGLGSNTATTGFGGFGNTQQQQQQPAATGLGGGFGSTQQQPATGTGLSGFGQQPQTSAFGGSLLGGQQQQAQKPQTSAFGGSLLGGQQQQTQQPQTSAFGSLLGGQQQQQAQPSQTNAFGGSLLGGQQQQAQPQQSQFGQATMVNPQPQQQEQSLSSSLWSPGRAITGVHRTVPMQMTIVKEKWDAQSRSSPFRTYLYNNVGEDQAPFYQPGPEDDEIKWEDALRQRKDPSLVPVLVKGFWELGKRAQRQKDYLNMMQTRLHEINNCLSDLLSRHDLKISLRIADCRRKHLVLSKRCLALAAKTQVLRNRGYAMDDAEEELKKKLSLLERSVFDPALNGRVEEIWARMLAIHETSKRLTAEMSRCGTNTQSNGEDEIDEETMKKAKKILDDYQAQIQTLQKEMESVKRDLEEVQK